MRFSVEAHPWKPRNYVIIDTDGGYDDFRALNLLLASPDIRVLAITTSNGVLEADQVYKKVKSLLFELHHEGMLVGMYNDSTHLTRKCIPALNFSWGTPVSDTGSIPSAEDIIENIIHNSEEPLTFISLGSLGTLADCINKVDQFELRLKQVLWSGNPDLDDNNFNYRIDTGAYNFVKSKSRILIRRIYFGFGNSVYTEKLQQSLLAIHNSYAGNILKSLQSDLTPYATRWYDESVAMYLHFPELFTADTLSNEIIYQALSVIMSQWDEKIVRILNGKTVNQNQVLKSFPMDTADYQDDVRLIMQETIYKYGEEEWIAGVLANELHRHLGIYAIVGVKMGIRAREYFGAGIDEMKVISYAGLQPPYSCMNDGLQVSMGATLGHGLIQVDESSKKLPEAQFTYLGRVIVIGLKETYRQKIENEVRELSAIYGLNNDIYWALVRSSALAYWANWDRNELFEIHVIR